MQEKLSINFSIGTCLKCLKLNLVVDAKCREILFIINSICECNFSFHFTREMLCIRVFCEFRRTEGGASYRISVFVGF